MAKIVIAELDLDIKALLKGAAESKIAIASLKNELIDLKLAGEASSEQFKKNEEDIKKLTQAFDSQVKALKEHIKKNEDLAYGHKKVAKQIAKTIDTQQELNSVLSQASDFVDSLTQSADDAVDSLNDFNKSLSENSALIEESSGSTTKQVKTFNDYKQQVIDSAQSINIFNGGLGGFISRAEEAGGAGPLLKNAFDGITTGIGGMTRAALTFMATPLGAAIALIAALLAPVIEYFKNTQEGIDKISAVTKPLQAVFQAFMGVVQQFGKAIVDALSNPKQLIKDLGDFILTNLINRFTAVKEIIKGILELDLEKTVNGVGQAITGVENLSGKIKNAAIETSKFLSDAANKGSEIDRLTKEIEKDEIALNQSRLKANNLMDEHLATSEDTNKSYSQRKSSVAEIIRISEELGNKEIAIIEKKIERLRTEQSLKGGMRADTQKMIDLEAELDQARDATFEKRKQQMAVLTNLKNAEQKDIMDGLAQAAQKQKLQLDLFLAQQGTKARSLQEELTFAEEVAKRKAAIALAEYNASSKTENDSISLKVKMKIAENELMEARARAAIEFADRTLQTETDKNRKILENDKFLSEELYRQKMDALEAIAKAEADALNSRLQNGVITQQVYDTEMENIRVEKQKAQDTLTEQRESAEVDRKLADIENKMASDENDFAARVELEREKNEILKNQEIEHAESTGADKGAIEKKYADADKALTKSVEDYKLGLRSQMAGMAKSLFKENTVAYKALAIGEATINTYLGATKALADYSYPIGPIFAGLTIAQGIATVSKIAGVKLEKGGLVSIGGKRHSSGGTMFRGEDGTTFEAEQGELIGVMNRNAASHFMAFNNAFPAGQASSQNYFAGGGLVSREITPSGIDIDMLALKIAEANRSLPPPVVAVQDIISESNSYIKIREGANF
ncbi:MAG: hypothetical protein EOO45_04280 [Flavobacterium sp.]|nr:MAG: hypothetical protein EOO45_04280 [Flavobacterium sp.]